MKKKRTQFMILSLIIFVIIILMTIFITSIPPIPPTTTTTTVHETTTTILEITFDTLKTCASDEDCVIINNLNKCPYCDRDEICGEIDYSKSKYIAVNSELFSNWQSENCPSKEECLQEYGPMPSCPITLINGSFEAKCVDGLCKKVAK